MSDEQPDYMQWMGRHEVCDDELALAPALAAAATLDDTATQFAAGTPLPPLWQWFYFLPRAPQAELDVDGHVRRGGFMPPIPYPRRMFAGGRMQFHRPLLIGRPARRVAEIRQISEKSGRTGTLAFVSLVHRFFQDEVLCIEEEQDIVYRQPGPPVAPPVPAEDWPLLPTGAWARVVTPDPRLLFRFSALTFNAHRIHYDRPYARDEEGYPGLVVHGPLTAVLLMEVVRRQAGLPVRRFSFRGLAPLFDLAPFRLVCTRSDEQRLALVAQAADGSAAMSAEAELAL